MYYFIACRHLYARTWFSLLVSLLHYYVLMCIYPDYIGQHIREFKLDIYKIKIHLWVNDIQVSSSLHLFSSLVIRVQYMNSWLHPRRVCHLLIMLDIQLHNCRNISGQLDIESNNRVFRSQIGDEARHSEELVPVRVLKTMPIDILRRTRGLPTKKWGSDHLALVCEFAFANNGNVS
ncbi:unnamed protein product [Lupinus luteus]|uniref:Uncharacterized protein n=1 Tax=Lupinus luteus TaxID=3873 RepID=A0AAV1XQG0_LUPLU